MELITLKSFDNYFLGNLTLTKLQDAGIECYLYNETGATVLPLGGNAIGGIKLVVKEEDFEAASKLMEQFDEEYMKSVKCPRCGKTDFVFVTKEITTNYITTLLNKLLSGNTIDTYNVYYCENCGYECDDLPYPDEE
jgi:predicted nucleic-acid-binding Zn-ribbon protein